MGSLTGKPVQTDPLTASDHIIVEVGGALKRVAARKAPRLVTSPGVGELADTDGYVRVGDGADNDTPVEFTIPANADEPIPVLGTITIECLSVGGLAILAASGVTVNPATSNGLFILYKNGIAVATKVDTDEWTVAGAQAG